MPSEQPITWARDECLEEAILCYLKAVEAGRTPEPKGFLAHYPDLTAELEQFLADQEHFNSLLSPVRHATPQSATELHNFGDYEVLEELGQGGIGFVFKGRDLDLGRFLAVKVLRAEYRDNASVVRRFVEEAQIGSQLQHPGIVPIYEKGRLPDGRPYFTMKLVKGETLASLLKRRADRSVDLPRFLGIFEQVCQTVAFAHSCGVIHRDLKPANVMVGAFGEVQVMDWGLAKVLAVGAVADRAADRGDGRDSSGVWTPSVETVADRSMPGAVMGTLAYMPPEQAQGKLEELDRRSDVFGLGAILCEVLTGSPPYVGGNLWSRAREADLVEARARLAACGADPELMWLALRCLEVSRDGRPADAAAVASQVTAHLESVQRRLRAAEVEAAQAKVKAEEQQKLAAQERRARRLRLGLAAAVLGLVLAGVAAWAWMEKLRADHAEDRSASLARTREGTDALLARATVLLERARKVPVAEYVQWKAALADFREAVSAARAAQELLTANETDEATRRRVGETLSTMEKELREAERDRWMVDEVTVIHLQQGSEIDGENRSVSDQPGTDRAYAEAFRKYGIEVDELSPAEAAARIRAGAIQAELTAALDDWYDSRRGQRKWDAANHLLEVARLVDSDPSRNAAREALLGRDRSALKQLADSPKTLDLPAATLRVIGKSLAYETRDREEAVQFLRKAQRRYPADFWINFSLGLCLLEMKPPELNEAARHFTAALALRPKNAGVYLNLGNALRLSGRLDEAIAEYRTAIELKHDYAAAYNNLGATLRQSGRPDEAVAEYRKALQLKPDSAEAHNNLGIALRYSGWLDEAIAEHRTAMRLKRDYAEAHCQLGVALRQIGRLREAVAEYREAIRLKHDYPDPHYHLGNVLSFRNELKEAADEYRQAIKLRPDFAEAHCNLGQVLQSQGRFDEALSSLKRGHDLGARQPRWTHPSAYSVQYCERLMEVEKKLAAAVAPSGAAERIEYATVCHYKRRHVVATRYFAEGFGQDSKMPGDAALHYRYLAACGAALAATGKGLDSDKLDEQERTRLRRQAVQWLRADLARWAKQLRDNSPQARWDARSTLRRWQTDPDLAGIRDQAVLLKLPDADRKFCQELWAEVETLLAQSES